MERQRDRETERQSDRETESQRDNGETGRQRDRVTETATRRHGEQRHKADRRGDGAADSSTEAHPASPPADS